MTAPSPSTETDPALYDLGLLLQINKAVTLCNLDRCDEALATAERARQLADRVGTSIRLAQAHNVLGQALYEMGRWDDALTEIAVVPEDLKEPPSACCELSIAAEIGFHRNEPEAARRHLAAAEPHAQRIGHRLDPTACARQVTRPGAGRGARAKRWRSSPHAFDGNPDDLGEIEDLFATPSGSRSRSGTRPPRRRSPPGRHARRRIGDPAPAGERALLPAAWSTGTPSSCSPPRSGTPTPGGRSPGPRPLRRRPSAWSRPMTRPARGRRSSRPSRSTSSSGPRRT